MPEAVSACRSISAVQLARDELRAEFNTFAVQVLHPALLEVRKQVVSELSQVIGQDPTQPPQRWPRAERERSPRSSRGSGDEAPSSRASDEARRLLASQFCDTLGHTTGPVADGLNARTCHSRIVSVDSKSQEEERTALIPQENIADIMGLAPSVSLRDRLRRYVTASTFDSVVCLLVVLNALLIGIETDYRARHVGDPVPLIFTAMTYAFLFMFSCELVIRTYVFRGEFFWGLEWRWNMFDVLCVLPQLLSVALRPLLQWTRGNTNTPIFRCARLIRLLRIARLLRLLHLLIELRTMVASIVGSARYLVWACVIIVLLVYTIAVFFTQEVTDWRASSVETSSAALTTSADLETYYGNVLSTSIFLWASISGGVDWWTVLKPLLFDVSPFAGVVFLIFIMFCVLVLMNVITGIFVEQATRTAQDDQNLYIAKHVIDLFHGSDLASDGDISWEVFESKLQTPEVQALFKILDVDDVDAHRLFQLIDIGDYGRVNPIELMHGMLRLRGPAKALDLALLLSETNIMHRRLHEHMGFVESTLVSLSSGRLTCELDSQDKDALASVHPNNDSFRPSTRARTSVGSMQSDVSAFRPVTPIQRTSQSELVGNTANTTFPTPHRRGRLASFERRRIM